MISGCVPCFSLEQIHSPKNNQEKIEIMCLNHHKFCKLKGTWTRYCFMGGICLSDTHHPLLSARPLHKVSVRTILSMSFFHNMPSDMTRYHSLHTASAAHSDLASRYERMFSATWSRPFAVLWIENNWECLVICNTECLFRLDTKTDINKFKLTFVKQYSLSSYTYNFETEQFDVSYNEIQYIVTQIGFQKNYMITLYQHVIVEKTEQGTERLLTGMIYFYWYSEFIIHYVHEI